jgi:hypothetical protein
MGRPLNKKYFGNRNIGTGGNQVGGPNSNSSNYADDKIGGEGIASVNWSTLGAWLSGAVGGLALPAPTIPGGVQATLSILYNVANVTTGAGKTNLAVGWKGTNASIPGLEITVTDVSGTNAVFAITTPATPFATIPFSGNGQGVTFTKSGGTGTAATFLADINWQVDSSTSVSQKGSGYTGAETFTVTTANGTPPAGTIVLTVDTGAVGSATNQENAILMKAKLNGGSATTVDIIRQVSTNRYKVTDGTRVGIVKLKSSVATATGEGSVRLVDTDGNTYFATKITAHKATIQRGTGVQAAFPNGASVKWNMIAAKADSLLIDNA